MTDISNDDKRFLIRHMLNKDRNFGYYMLGFMNRNCLDEMATAAICRLIEGEDWTFSSDVVHRLVQNLRDILEAATPEPWNDDLNPA